MYYSCARIARVHPLCLSGIKPRLGCLLDSMTQQHITCTIYLRLGKFKRSFNSPCTITLMESLAVVTILVTQGKKLCNMDVFVVRITLKTESDIISDSTVVKFKVLSLVEYFFVSNTDRISSSSLLHDSGLNALNEEGAFLQGTGCCLNMEQEYL